MIELPKYVFLDDSTMVRADVPNLIRTKMEAGPDKIKKIQTTPLFNCSCDVSINVSRLKDFRTWKANDLNGGSSWFLMNDPFDGVKRRFRFILDNEIEWTKAGNLLTAKFVLEGYDEL